LSCVFDVSISIAATAAGSRVDVWILFSLSLSLAPDCGCSRTFLPLISSGGDLEIVDVSAHGGVGDVDAAGAEAQRVLTVDSALLSERMVVAIDQ
jgi:hypothetical protein